MKLTKRLLWLPAILFFAVMSAHAQKTETSQSSPKYRMELVYLFEANSTEFIFVVGNVGFKTVDSLKKFVGNLPAGSILEWAPGCIRFGKEPLLSSEQELEDFKAFCARSGIKFVLIPAG